MPTAQNVDYPAQSPALAAEAVVWYWLGKARRSNLNLAELLALFLFLHADAFRSFDFLIRFSFGLIKVYMVVLPFYLIRFTQQIAQYLQFDSRIYC